MHTGVSESSEVTVVWEASVLGSTQTMLIAASVLTANDRRRLASGLLVIDRWTSETSSIGTHYVFSG